MNDVLKDYIGIFVVAYIYGILIFNNTRVEHLEHVEMVLRNLCEEKLAINLDKCEFINQELVYLGLLVSKRSLKMGQDKVAIILNYPPPSIKTKVRSSHGLA